MRSQSKGNAAVAGGSWNFGAKGRDRSIPEQTESMERDHMCVGLSFDPMESVRLLMDVKSRHSFNVPDV